MAGGGEHPRPTLAAGVDLLAAGSPHAHLLSGRRHGSYLFLRYACNPEHQEVNARPETE
jgi:hypothetical protein